MKQAQPSSSSSSSRRTEIQHIFDHYSSGEDGLRATGLLQFLQREQAEPAATDSMADSLIDKYEIDETARTNKTMTFQGFLRYMESKNCCVLNQEHTRVYQDMGHPLCQYFISSSHNTYLTADQLVGKSHLFAYVSALRRGCRCLEIDCWDGSDAEPVVYHGYTLTSKILFRDVIATIEQHAFEVSPYPVILSLENHCSPPQQQVMAQYLTSILGDKLLSASLDPAAPEELPSPQELQYKILIKNKKLSPGQEKEQGAGKDRKEEQGEEGEGREEEEDSEEEEEDNIFRIKYSLLLLCPPNSQKGKVKVAVELSRLVIYTKSVKFISFSHSRENQHFFENTSLVEKKARKLTKVSGPEFVLHNASFISRIYPAGSRTLSSNYNPQEFWNVGSQLVALNFQSLGLPMDLNNGRFQDNGGCGYVLKPHFLRSRETTFDPSSPLPDLKPAQLLMKVISGSNLPVSKTSKAPDLYVRVEIHGVPSDNCRKKTDPVKRNSLNPRWDASMSFTISVPELALIRFTVRDHSVRTGNDFVAQYTLPFSSMKKGYRWVPLLSREGQNLDPASLFIFVWYS
ncbi:1-phosphatidylinositol 4,5-bisphosphate phosphodiesterase zeta-1-like [Megalops cyprinoides]|uniref:1-phosphatidylinositol 4,5-bisphosphate phosphodiesterase zeta-1-like n=1 Tax=Megalops cyprinoides TaxID=118141 RepID=UPI0018649985|nr:1-phosphatidylinositol 4,5-bisphosphate phosphodiesterase zeta-1-like [Megalops cyprinoides]